MSGFFALLNDIATLAKLTLSTVDDTASMAVRTSAEVSAAAVDDVTTTPQYVTGTTPDRGLPIIKKITRGSLRNKLLIILPIGLLLMAVVPWLLSVALVIDGAYLCLEDGEKILERFGGAAHTEVESGPVDEAQIIRQAITTDFVLFTKIMLLAPAEVEGESSMQRVIVLVLIALLITFVVYGLVAALIKLDDAGAHLAGQGRTGAIRSLGRAIMTSAPALFRGIGIIGTVAILWVGGHILVANLAGAGFHPLHYVIEWAEELTHNPVLSWIIGAAMSCLIGAVIGALLTLAWRPVHHALVRRHKG